MTGGELEAAQEEALPGEPAFGRWLFWLASALLFVVAALEVASVRASFSIGIDNRWPTHTLSSSWGVALGVSQVVEYGEIGDKDCLCCRRFCSPAPW